MPHVTPHAPQFELSVSVFAQYAAPPSGVQSVSAPPSPPPHELLHAPFWQTCPFGHVFPHAPQFALSVCVFAQYGEPLSPPQNV